MEKTCGYVSQPPKKAKVVKSMWKVLCVVLNSGIILVHMVNVGTAVNAAYYSKVLKC